MRYFDLPPIIEQMLVVSDKISDLNFSVGQAPQVEINGKLTPVQPQGLQKLTPYQTELIAMTLLQGNPEAAQRLTHTGSIYVTLVCLLPELLIVWKNVPFYFGGTSLLIIVVVTMDFMAQVQAYVMSHQYESLLKKANFKTSLGG